MYIICNSNCYIQEQDNKCNHKKESLWAFEENVDLFTVRSKPQNINLLI